jgi:hypothetical protein
VRETSNEQQEEHLAVVIMTDSPTSALAKYEMMLLAVPPGQHATNIIPARKGVARPGSNDNRKPRVGMMVYCSTAPTVTRYGFFNTDAMSSTDKVNPMQSIVMPRNVVTQCGLYQLTYTSGKQRPAQTESGTNGAGLVSKDRASDRISYAFNR